MWRWPCPGQSCPHPSPGPPGRWGLCLDWSNTYISANITYIACTIKNYKIIIHLTINSKKLTLNEFSSVCLWISVEMTLSYVASFGGYRKLKKVKRTLWHFFISCFLFKNICNLLKICNKKVTTWVWYAAGCIGTPLEVWPRAKAIWANTTKGVPIWALGLQ